VLPLKFVGHSVLLTGQEVSVNDFELTPQYPLPGSRTSL
jgi:hypothetical protein